MTLKENIEMNVAVIPARYASVRLPGKPLIDLCGKPMILRVYEQVKKARLVHRIIVATDNKMIADVVAGFGGEVVMTPADVPTGTDRAALAARRQANAGIVVNVQGDEPLIPPQMIDEVITLLVNDPAALAGTLVQKITSPDEITDTNIVKAVLDERGYACYFSRSPVPFPRDGIGPDIFARNTWYRHVGIYAFRKSFLEQFYSWEQTGLEKVEMLEQLRIIGHGYRIKTSVTEHRSISVDTPEDAERVRSIISEKGVP